MECGCLVLLILSRILLQKWTFISSTHIFLNECCKCGGGERGMNKKGKGATHLWGTSHFLAVTSQSLHIAPHFPDNNINLLSEAVGKMLSGWKLVTVMHYLQLLISLHLKITPKAKMPCNVKLLTKGISKTLRPFHVACTSRGIASSPRLKL